MKGGSMTDMQELADALKRAIELGDAMAVKVRCAEILRAAESAADEAAPIDESAVEPNAALRRELLEPQRPDERQRVHVGAGRQTSEPAFGRLRAGDLEEVRDRSGMRLLVDLAAERRGGIVVQPFGQEGGTRTVG